MWYLTCIAKCIIQKQWEIGVTGTAMLIYCAIVSFLLGNSPPSAFYMPTFRNTVPSSKAGRFEEKCWGIYTGNVLSRKYPEPIGKRITGYFQAINFPLKIPHFSNLVILHTYLPMKMEHTERSETSECEIQTPWNYPEESIQKKAFRTRRKFQIKYIAFCCLLQCSCFVSIFLCFTWSRNMKKDRVSCIICNRQIFSLATFRCTV